MDLSIAEKIQEYETFLNETLREDLKILEKKLEETNEKLADWYIFKKSICDIREHHSQGFKTYVELGGGILCQAKVADPSVINVNVGLNVYLKMTLDEANQFCDIKIKILKGNIEVIQNQAIKVKAHIKVVLLGLKELQNL